MSDIQWANAVSAYFDTPADWTGGVVPGANDTAILDAGGADFTVTAHASHILDGLETATNATLLVNGGTFAAGAVINAGTISAVDGATVQMLGAIANSGLIEATGAGVEIVDGTLTNTGEVLLPSGGNRGSGFTLQNATLNDTRGGTIELGVYPEPSSNGVNGVTLDNGVILGGDLTLPKYSQVRVYNPYGYAYGVIGTNTLTVQGDIYVGLKSSLTLKNDVVNNGNIFLDGGGVLHIGDGGLTLSGTGTLGFSNTDVVGNASGLTLANSSTIGGSGELGGNQMVIVNAAGGVISADGSSLLLAGNQMVIVNAAGGVISTVGYSLLTIGAGNTIINAGLIEGDVSISSPLDNTGTVLVNGLGLSLLGPVTGGGDVSFTKSTGELHLGQSQTFAETISGFTTVTESYYAITGGTSLDLGDIGFVSPREASFSGTSVGGVLTVTDGVHTAGIHLAGNFTHDEFIAASDGQGGTLIGAETAIQWAAATSGDFSTASNWAGGVAPSAHDIAVIANPGQAFVVTVGSATVAGIVTGANVTLDASDLTANFGTGSGANAGVIVGDVTFTGQFVNTGKIEGSLDCNRGCTLSGGGQVILDGGGIGTSRRQTQATFTNIDNTISGSGYISGYTTINNDGVINADTSETLYIAVSIDDGGYGTVTNRGTFEATRGGTLAMEGSSDDDSLLYDNSGVLRAADATMIIYPFAIVSGAGHAVIDDGTLTVLGGLDQSVYFEGKTGVLALAQATTFDSLIFGFSNMGGDSLDLGDIKFGSSTSANFSGTAKRGVLTVTDGTDTARITLIGDYLASTFTVASDGDGGTTVTATPSSPSGGSPAHALVAATASFAPPEMGSERQARMDGFSPRLLALPHTAIA